MIEERVRELVGTLVADADRVSPARLVDDISALEAAIASLQAAQAVKVAQLARVRERADRAAGAGADQAGRGAAAEVAMARRVSKTAAQTQLAYALPLVDDHPRLLAGCLDGTVAQPAAKAIVAATEVLEPAQRRAVDTELAAVAGQLTPGQARKAAHRAVTAVDADAAAKRAERARADKHVRAVVDRDGTGTVLATLPVEQTVAVWEALDHTARGMRNDGDDRSIRELMCDLLVERVTGVSKAAQPAVEVGVVISASSLLGVDDQPAKLTGHHGRGDYGVLPAPIARRLATSDHAWARRLVCDPANGRLVTMDTRRRRFTGPLRTFLIYRDGTSRRPYSDTPVYDIDHITRWIDGGPTSAANAEGLAVGDHHLLDLPGWTVTAVDDDAGTGVEWTTPTGHRYESRPPPILGHGNTRQQVPRRPDHHATIRLLLARLLLNQPHRPHRRPTDN